MRILCDKKLFKTFNKLNKLFDSVISSCLIYFNNLNIRFETFNDT